MEENAYLELCNKLKELYGVGKNQEKNAKGLYRLTVIVPEFTQLQHDNFRLTLNSRPIIVKLTTREYENIKKGIKDTGSYSLYQPHIPFPNSQEFFIFQYAKHDSECEYEDEDRTLTMFRNSFTITQHDHHCVVAIDKLE